MAPLLSLLLSLHLLASTDPRSTFSQELQSSSPDTNITLPEYWSCCLNQRVPSLDPLASLYCLYFGPPPQLLEQCR